VEQPSQSDKGVCSKLCTRKDNYYKSKFAMYVFLWTMVNEI